MVSANFWDVFYAQSPLKTKFVETSLQQHKGFDEKTSDDCIIELLGKDR